MNNQEILEQFKKEFSHVYEWHDEAGTEYPEHAHKDKVSIFITLGEVDFAFTETGEKKKVSAGERFDVPVGAKHTAFVGPAGSRYIVGEMIEGDS